MKDNKKLWPAVAAEQGNAVVSILVVLVVAAAGILGFMAGQKAQNEQLMAIPASAPPAAADVADAKENTEDNPVIAKVNGSSITRQEVIEFVNGMPAQMRQYPLPQLFPMALEQMINNKVVDRKAALSGLEKDPDVQKQLWIAKEQIIRAKYVENAVEERINEDRIRTKYEEYLKNFPEIQEVKASHILVEDEATAKKLIKELDGGADFAELAKENSTDGSAERGGELGYFADKEVVPEFAEVAFKTEVGTYAKNPVKSEFGYHVIRVEDKRKRPPAEYEKIKPFIKQELNRTVLEEVLNEWRNGAKIERFDINGNPIPEGAEAEKMGEVSPEAGAADADDAANDAAADASAAASDADDAADSSNDAAN